MGILFSFLLHCKIIPPQFGVSNQNSAGSSVKKERETHTVCGCCIAQFVCCDYLAALKSKTCFRHKRSCRVLDLIAIMLCGKKKATLRSRGQTSAVQNASVCFRQVMVLSIQVHCVVCVGLLQKKYEHFCEVHLHICQFTTEISLVHSNCPQGISTKNQMWSMLSFSPLCRAFVWAEWFQAFLQKWNLRR